MVKLADYAAIIAAIREITPSAHIAGETVRDTILERPIRDIDILLAEKAREAAAKLLRSQFGYV
jgi:tRNA nucleotidyltransferase/poly(A) polymerase